jgi:hypothetical protein
VCLPSYLWDPGDVDPPAVRRPRKFQILHNLRNLGIFVKLSFSPCLTALLRHNHKLQVPPPWHSVPNARFHQQQQQRHRPQIFPLNLVKVPWSFAQWSHCKTEYPSVGLDSGLRVYQGLMIPMTAGRPKIPWMHLQYTGSRSRF